MAPGDLEELRIVGGHPALDLANTLAPRLPGGVDYLRSPEALVEWAALAGVIDSGEKEHVAASEAALRDTRTLRAMIDPVLDGHDLDALTRRWSAAMARSTLEAEGSGRARLRVGTDPALLIPDRLADAVVDLLRNADLSRLRACPVPDGGCGFLFLDRSRNGSRRWCSMDDCGTVVKSRRLTERRRNVARSDRPTTD
jgi:predicted RNA-binding Zn ribbon-like protein